jgi:hypothetical protein
MLKSENYMRRLDMDVLVFKTNISTPDINPTVERHLRQLKGISRWSIDFSDRDKVLRVEAHNAQPSEIITVMNSAGFRCEELA